MTFCGNISHLHLINRLKQPSAPGAIPLIFSHSPPLSKRRRVWFSSSAEARCCCWVFFPSPSPLIQTEASLCVILMNARGLFTECKCEEAQIHLDFRSPSESIRGGSMSICYLDVTLSLHKRKDGPTSNLAAARVRVCVCVKFCSSNTSTPLFSYIFPLRRRPSISIHRHSKVSQPL